MRDKRALLVIGLALVTVCGIVVLSLTKVPYTNPLYIARTLVPAGTERDLAVATLGARAWYHQECCYANSDVIEDLFFYGSHGYDEAFIVIVNYSGPLGTTYRVSKIGSFEYYAWHTAFRDCIDTSRFDDYQE